MEAPKSKKLLQQSTLFTNRINYLFYQILFFICLISNISSISNIEENQIIQSSSNGSDFFFLTKTEGILYYTPQSTSSSATYTFSSTPIKNLTPKIIKMSSDYFISCVSDAMFLLIDSSRNNLFKYGDSRDVSNIDFCFSQHYRYSTVLSYIIKSNKHLIYIYDYEINNMTIVNEEYTITESSTNLLNNFNKPDSCVLMKYILLCSYRLTTTNKIQFYILDLKQKVIKEVNMGFSETSTELKTTKFYTYSYKQNNFLLAKYYSNSTLFIHKYNYDINTNILSLDDNFSQVKKSKVNTLDSFDIIFFSKKFFLLARNYNYNVEMVKLNYITGIIIEHFDKSQNCNSHYFIQMVKVSDTLVAAISACAKKSSDSIIYEIYYMKFFQCVNKTFDSNDFSSDSNSFEIDIENNETYKIMNGYTFQFISLPDGIDVNGDFGWFSNKKVTTSSFHAYNKLIFTKLSNFIDGQRVIEYMIYSSDVYSDVCYFIFNYYPCCEECDTCSAQCDKDNGHYYCSTCQEDYYILKDDSSICYKRDKLLDYYYFNKEDENFQKCKKSCKTCKSYEDCLTCDDNYQESDFFHNDVDETKCVPYCETSGTWMQNVENKQIQCLNSKNDCKNLYNKYLLEDSFNNNECIPKCNYKNYTYIFNDEKCTDSCVSIKKYYIPNDLKLNNITKEIRCLDECKDDYPFYGDNFQCLKKCENLYIKSNKTCTNSCLLYDLFLYKNEVCIDNCPFYYLADNKECVDSCIQYNKYYIPIPYNLTNDNPCLDSCSGLFPYYGDNNQCLQLCPYYYLSENNTCVSSCVTFNKYYEIIPDVNSNSNNIPCLDSCSGTFPYYGENNQCLNRCPLYYLQNNKKCVSSCIPYNKYYETSPDVNSNTNNIPCIDSCTGSFPYYGENNQCLNRCPLYYLQNNKKCVSSCITYNKYYETSPDVNSNTNNIPCLDSCSGSFPYYGDNNQCLQLCPLYYLSENNTCVSSCVTFNKYYEILADINSNTNNIPCLDSCTGSFPYYGDNNQCLNKCPLYYLQNDKKCVSSCITYKKYYIKIPQNITDDNPCMDSCPSDFPFYGDNYQCLKECPNYYLPNKTCVNSCNYYNENLLIKECIDSCSDTSEGYHLYDSNINKICYESSCPTNYPFLTLPNICSNNCISQKFFDVNTKICQNSCDSLESNTCKNICSFNSTYLIPDLGICVDQCDPLLYTEKDDYFYCENFYGLYNATTKEDIIDIINERINKTTIKDSEFNSNKFLISIQNTKETDKEKEEILNSDYAYVDLGECENILKKENNIPDEEPLIILVIEEIDNSKMCYNLNYTVFSSHGKKLDLSVCDGSNFHISTPIRNTSGIRLDEAEEFFSQNIDVFNRSDLFFNDLCYKYTSKQKTDVIINDRVDNFYQNATFCQDAGDCSYLAVDFEHKRVNCECETKTIINEEEDNKKANFNDVISGLNVNNFLNALKSSTVNVVICYNLVFSVEFFTGLNYGGYFFICLFILHIVLFIVFILGKMKYIKNNVNRIVFGQRNDLSLQTIQNNKDNKNNINNINSNENVETPKKILSNDTESRDNLIIKKSNSRKKAIHSNIVSSNRGSESIKIESPTKKISKPNPPKIKIDNENNLENLKNEHTYIPSKFQKQVIKFETNNKNNDEKLETLDNKKEDIKNGDLNEPVIVKYNNKKYKISSNVVKPSKIKTISKSINNVLINNDQNILETKSLNFSKNINYEDIGNLTVYNTSNCPHLELTQKTPALKAFDEDIFAKAISTVLIGGRLKRKNKKKNEQRDSTATGTEIGSSKKVSIRPKYSKKSNDVLTINDFYENDDELDNQSKENLKRKKKRNRKKLKKAKEQKYVERLLKYEDYLINYLDFDDAIKFDNRLFFKMYKDILLLSHNLLYTFFFDDKLNLKTVTLSLFFFSLSMNLVVNCLFYDDENISHTFYLEGDFDFLFNLPQTIYSSIISLVLSMITQILTSVKNKLLFVIFGLENKTKKEVNKIYKRMKIKIKIYFIFVIIISAIFWYYIAAFCAVYPNSQKEFFIDTITSFGFEIISPFAFALFISWIKYSAIRKKSKCLYDIAEFLV